MRPIARSASTLESRRVGVRSRGSRGSQNEGCASRDATHPNCIGIRCGIRPWPLPNANPIQSRCPIARSASFILASSTPSTSSTPTPGPANRPYFTYTGTPVEQNSRPPAVAQTATGVEPPPVPAGSFTLTCCTPAMPGAGPHRVARYRSDCQLPRKPPRNPALRLKNLQNVAGLRLPHRSVDAIVLIQYATVENGRPCR